MQAILKEGSGADHCPDGYQAVSEVAANLNKAAACKALGERDIMRLSGDGSLDGLRCHCAIIEDDPRGLSGTLCRQSY